jgi:DNA-binding beta-propeller fold protein YncE
MKRLTLLLFVKEYAMKNIRNLQGIRARVSLAVLALIVGLGTTSPNYAADSLYVADGSDNTVKRFHADTGAFQGEFVKKGNSPIKGPRGLIFNAEGDLLVSNQNVGANKSGEILKHIGVTGEFLVALVPHNDPNAPFAPLGIVLRNNVLFVSDLQGKGNDVPPGRLLAYTGGGVFLADLTPDPVTEFPGAFSTDEFHPRGVVLGPDGLLYVSVVHDLDPKSTNFNPANVLAGWILRFDPTNNGSFVDVFASDEGAGCAAHLHRPEGLVFGPDGRLYVTAFRANSSDTDKVLIFDGTGSCVDQIDLDQVGQPRAFAQAILFGPEGFLFVPINGNGPDTGAVRRYNVADKTFVNFVLPAAQGGPLGQPWYLTFGETDPGTLEYNP